MVLSNLSGVRPSSELGSICESYKRKERKSIIKLEIIISPLIVLKSKRVEQLCEMFINYLHKPESKQTLEGIRACTITK